MLCLRCGRDVDATGEYRASRPGYCSRLCAVEHGKSRKLAAEFRKRAGPSFWEQAAQERWDAVHPTLCPNCGGVTPQLKGSLRHKKFCSRECALLHHKRESARRKRAAASKLSS
jgi:endogenous inhibitor of DNA gyrase (YacG/DUF329 family)